MTEVRGQMTEGIEVGIGNAEGGNIRQRAEGMEHGADDGGQREEVGMRNAE